MLLRTSLPVHTAVWLVCAALALVVPSVSQARITRIGNGADIKLSATDDAFLTARDAFKAGDRDRLAAAAGRLAGHPLASYVEAWQLQARLRGDDPARADDAVADFLKRHEGSVVADRMRLEWLLSLGARRDYARFESELRRLVWNDDAQVHCYAALVRYQRNVGRRIDELAREAMRVLAASREPGGDGCWALTEALLVDERASAWERMRALVENNQLATAKRLVAFLPKFDSAQITLAIDRPAAWLGANEKRLESMRELAHIATSRLARDEPHQAARWAAQLDANLTAESRAQLWGRIGHMAAFKLMPEAIDWYRNGGALVGVTPLTARADEVLEWQVRAALRGTKNGTDWAMVRATVERMPDALKRDPAWIYWRGRAYLAEGRSLDGQDILRLIAGQFNFYGQLAAEELGRPIVAPPPPAEAPAPEQVAAFAPIAGYARAFKFHELGMRLEASREWSWEIRRANDGRGLSDRELIALAEFARSRNFLDRMISSSERTRSELDFGQRYPSPHRESLARHAKAAALDETWLYGLIRQESRFIADARSSAGAQGLMQLMPSTARYVARRVGMNDYQATRIAELDVNLRLGTSYLRYVLDDLDGHPILATAAYNAGPRRAREWRASLARPVEGAIFAETIPFAETREYVKKVMSNSVWYAALFEGRAQSMKSRLGSIAPKDAGSTELP